MILIINYKKIFSNKIEKIMIALLIQPRLVIKKKRYAFQNFTNSGPIAFLPISNIETSIVYSLTIIKKTLKLKTQLKNIILFIL